MFWFAKNLIPGMSENPLPFGLKTKITMNFDQVTVAGLSDRENDWMGWFVCAQRGMHSVRSSEMSVLSYPRDNLDWDS